MEIRERSFGAVVILDVIGRMVLGEGSDERFLRNTVVDRIALGCRHFIVNLSQVSQMDTMGLTALVVAHLAVVRNEGHIKFAGPPKRVVDLLRITRLDTLFDISATEQDAIESFAT